MPEPTEEDINRRADELWEQAGCPKNRDSDYLAEQELRSVDKSNPLRTPEIYEHRCRSYRNGPIGGPRNTWRCRWWRTRYDDRSLPVNVAGPYSEGSHMRRQM
jgi:hypothetical protein